MLKILGSTESKIRPGEGGVGVGGNRARRKGSKLDRNKLYGSKVDGAEVDGGEVEDNEVGEKVQKRSKSKNSSKSKNLSKFISDFLTPGAKLTFIKLRQAFLKAPILHHFDPECHIRIEIDVSGYAISGVFS